MGHMARMEGRDLVGGNLKARGLSGDMDVGGRIMLKWILKKK